MLHERSNTAGHIWVIVALLFLNSELSLGKLNAQTLVPFAFLRGAGAAQRNKDDGKEMR